LENRGVPIYEYRCESCGHQQEFLQKVSDPPLTVCTKCGKPTFTKMVTAAGFHLKGSGWYATDFKNSGAKPAAKPAESTDAKPAAPPAADAKPATEAKPASEAKPAGEKKTSPPSSGAA
jgi:putative FmdB family regulatory protein